MVDIGRHAITKLTLEEIEACKEFGFNHIVTKNDVKKRYRELALEHHPDKGGDSEKFKKVVSAYELLNRVTPLDCSQQTNREYQIVHSWIFGDMRRETETSKKNRFSRYAPEGFTQWRDYL
jgi:curved DNA-binding protein CbpA